MTTPETPIKPPLGEVIDPSPVAPSGSFGGWWQVGRIVLSGLVTSGAAYAVIDGLQYEAGRIPSATAAAVCVFAIRCLTAALTSYYGTPPKP